MKSIIFFVFLLSSLSSEANTSRFNLEITSSLQILNIETQQSSSSNAATASFNVLGFSPIIQYSLLPKVAALFSYESLTDMTTQAKFTGTRAGIRYYLKTDNVISRFNSEVVTLQKFPNYSYYAELSYSSLSLDSDDLSINFNGIQLALGAFFHFYQQYYLIGDISYKMMSAGEIRTLNAISFMFGVGTYFY